MDSVPKPPIRKASLADAPAVLDLIDALADYEKLDRPTDAARERLVADLFGPTPRIECYLGFVGDCAAGYAIVVETYSSFLALPTLYLEDLFVLPQHRGKRLGYALFERCRDEAVQRGCGRMEWTVLNWNRLAIEFYERIGGRKMDEWHLYRIDLTSPERQP
jgi:GNAT superfamily N-acetyltransferase